MSSTPETVEPGQVWRDNDERSKGAGEFEVIELGVDWKDREVAKVYRPAIGRHTTIRVDRLLSGPYTYIGRAR